LATVALSQFSIAFNSMCNHLYDRLSVKASMLLRTLCMCTFHKMYALDFHSVFVLTIITSSMNLDEQNCADWIKISEMILGPVPENFKVFEL
jgi:hypothetical protein